MGKKLRNRELSTQTDLESELESSVVALRDTISALQIGKAVRSSLSLRKGITKASRNNFTKRFNNKQLSPIITSHRFQCPVCLELMVNPVLITCGHAYCSRCLESNIAYSQKCCLCRSEQRRQPSIPLSFAETFIEKFLIPTGPQLIRYLCRTTDSAEWLKRRRIASFKLGLVIDFQDRCGIWRRGVIVDVSNNDQVQIKTSVKGEDIYERVERTSKRLAPYTFFTRNRYLEDFPPALPEHDPIQHSLSKLQYHERWEEDSAFFFPEEAHSQAHQGEGMEREQFQDQAMRIFNSEMNEIDSILNI